jgi:hypothetical protein
VSNSDWPTVNERSVATRRNIDATAVSPFAISPTWAGPVAVHGSSSFTGTVNVTDVVVADVTVAATPFTMTWLPAIVAPKFVPVREPVPPGTSVVDEVPVIDGVTRLRTRRLTESTRPSVEARTYTFPGVTPVTTPPCVIVAIAVFADDQVIVRPVIGRPIWF